MVANNMKYAVIGMILVGTIFASLFPLFLSLMLPGDQTLSQGEVVKVQHVNQIVQDLVTNDIRTSYLSAERLEMEFMVTPDNSYFTVIIELRTPTTRAGRATDPDVRFTVGRDVVARLLSAGDFFAEVKKVNNEGKIQMEMLKPLDELLEKGYGEIYGQIVK